MKPDDIKLIEVLLAVSAGFFVLGLFIRWIERVPQKWPRASGKIITSTNSDGTRHVTPIIEYEFTYQGKLIKSSHWRLGNYSEGCRETTDDVTSRYPVGLPVTVYVNTQHPEESVLEVEPSRLSWVLFILGSVGLMMTVCTVLVKHQK
jgi:hypothetical protein